MASVPITGFSQSIQHQVDIDEMLLSIAALDAQIAHYDELKKHRVALIATEVAKLEATKEQYRQAIRQFMAAQGEKTLNYPGVGKVSRKAGSRKWNINNETDLIAFLEANPNISPQLIAKVIVTEKTLVKKELNKLLDDLHQHNALTTPAVTLEASEETVSITFDKGDAMLATVKDRTSTLLAAPITALPAPTQSSVASYDALDV
jgi:DNA primase